jgi:hypothetical protein
VSAVTRREALAGALAGAAALGLQACGGGGRPRVGPHDREVARTSFAIDYASYYAPAPDLTRLVLARAGARKLSVVFSQDAAGAAAQAVSLRRLTGERGGFRVVVVAPFEAAATDPIARTALGRGVQIVSFMSPLAHQTAAIDVDGAAAARTLVAHAARQGGGEVLLVVPPASSPVPDPFFAVAQRAARALAAAVGAAELDVAGTVTALGAADAATAVRAALKVHPRARTVLSWNDATALGAAQVVERTGYVGALGAPAVTTAAALRALDDDDSPLRCLVAPCLSTLAAALVDVPASLLKGSPARSVTVLAERFTRGAPATRAALRDYA